MGRNTSSVYLMVQNISGHSIELTDLFLFNEAIAIPLLNNGPKILANGK